MIGHETAEKMAIKFFKADGCWSIARDVEEGYCVDATFARAVRRLGKRAVCDLYWRLPLRLHIYFTVVVTGGNDSKLWKKISDVDDKYVEIEYSPRPERLKCFLGYFKEKRKILLSYFKTGVCASERK